ncbi:hypothetical protein, partial [Serratia marcescens]|uniref:hypothetical protein n=1 Tax=Serratia marcescens TaxID=615 RepID=UPI002812C4CB
MAGATKQVDEKMSSMMLSFTKRFGKFLKKSEPKPEVVRRTEPVEQSARFVAEVISPLQASSSDEDEDAIIEGFLNYSEAEEPKP